MDRDNVSDKNGEPIHEGDYVYTRIRGGTHEGKVEEIVTDGERAEETSVKHPPKVLLHNKDGKTRAHNPGTLEICNEDA
ncbi:uncharacterized protein N7498_006831 [Penicillium cinerascens]|uniref:Hypervirulence associated protein TUDOR domain-containing protein n=1 Tax=Penicillium cinerascens TaxID=70096 RepID=A0A9W9JIQ6_9EURO|nr:uncharacterized protein N7498_006831 [Penicillium cinerascens]KAJ5197714.1 hypothetical protein N7498_006831 [Penicillium cinerascens]